MKFLLVVLLFLPIGIWWYRRIKYAFFYVKKRIQEILTEYEEDEPKTPPKPTHYIKTLHVQGCSYILGANGCLAVSPTAHPYQYRVTLDSGFVIVNSPNCIIEYASIEEDVESKKAIQYH